MLKGKTILLGVTGGIAAYKAAALASALVKQRAHVEVIMTAHATEFIAPLTFEQLTGNRCMVDTFDRNFSHQVEHIALADRTDLVLIAPATANVCGKLAHGLADDMLTTTVLARDGSVIGYFYRENRFLISLDEMPKTLPQAFLAAEDAEFYEHEGVNPVAIFRAFLINLRSGTHRQGGSTITQQVIKRLLLTPERTYERKIKEAILAYRLERYLSKDEILTIYLNQTFLGSNAYGVEAAARTYFGKRAKDLTVAECAVIAGLPKAPSQDNPYHNPEAAITRQHYVLRRLRELNWITEAQYDEAMRQPLVFKSMSDGMGRQGAWYLEEVRRQLIDLFSEENAKQLGMDLPVYGEEAVYQMGFTVQTAMEPSAQRAADAALREGLEAFTRRQGWPGPVEKIPAAKLKERLEKSSFAPAMLANGERIRGIVTLYEDKGATVSLGKYTGFIDKAHLAWARKSIRGKQKFLEPGDVVWVSALGPDPKTPFKPEEAAPDKLIPLTLESVPEVQGALVSIEPENGDVVAMVGGYNFRESQFNRATQAHRQPGSSFKSIVYSAALDNGFTPASVLLDAPVVQFLESGDVWRPNNYEKNFKGPLLLRTALALSRNLCTIRVVQQMGVQKVIERAKDLELEPHFPEVLSVSLGAVAVTPLNMTQAYTAFANGGMVSKARFILSVKNFWGEPVYETQPDLRDAITPQNAYLMSYLLKEAVNAGTATKAKVLGRPVAGKTGTSNDWKDAWFIGFTPHLVTGLYVGYDQPRTMGRSGSGSSLALPIFVEYAKTALNAYPPDDFDVPDGITFANVDPSSGHLVSGGGLRLPFYTGTEPGSSTSEEAISGVNTRGEDLLKQMF